MSVVERQKYLQKITIRLTIFTGVILLVVAVGLYNFYQPLGLPQQHSYLALLVFVSGLLGGFVSIQQRLPTIKLAELKSLSSSWLSITLAPINGGIFALVLMLMFIGNIIQGTLFPKYLSVDISNIETFRKWLVSAYPTSGVEVAKLLFWSFVAGFVERFVPQLIKRTVEEVEADQSQGGEAEESEGENDEKDNKGDN
jgi:hypothetical protein